MQATTGSKPYWCCSADFGQHEDTCKNWPKPEVLNPTVYCGESVHIEEPEHHTSGGLDNPFLPKKVVDKDPEVR